MDASGHHYQYAVHCLTAAKDLGYEPILAINKNNNIAKAPWKIFGVYTSTFWEYDKYEPIIIRSYRKLETFNNQILNFILLNGFGHFLMKKLLDKKRITEFAKDTKELIKQINLAEGDVVFLPTSGLVEMFGILECEKLYPSCKKATWHFLFRRSIHTGVSKRDFPYLKLELMRKAFETFHKKTTLQPYFYTDSVQLTQQYEQLGVKFDTLPIPHTIAKSTSKNLSKTIKVAYLGDARDEKGYHHLPHVVQDLWHDYVNPEKITFTIQSYFSHHQIEPKTTVALSQLQTFDSDKVQLIRNPLDPGEYQNLLIGSDVVLLPYDKVNYRARTSGILVEALCCNIPVVVPAGTWLSRQFIKEVYQYQRSLGEKFLKKSYDEITLHYEKNLQTNSISDKLILDKKRPTAYAFLEMDDHPSHILVTLFFEDRDFVQSIIIDCIQMTSDDLPIVSNSNLVEKSDLPYATVILPIHSHTKKIKILLKNAGQESVLSKISVDALNFNQRLVPLSTIGIIYDISEEIFHKLANIVDNYDHYLQTAKEFSVTYIQKHNAKSLIQQIIKNTKTVVFESNPE
jgi:glycosyltransferase involved in cell wall biosynthesis